MKHQITNIILDMTGEDKQYTKFISNEHPTNEDIDSYNQALRYLRDKAPEIAERITRHIIKELNTYDLIPVQVKEESPYYWDGYKNTVDIIIKLLKS